MHVLMAAETWRATECSALVRRRTRSALMPNAPLLRNLASSAPAAFSCMDGATAEHSERWDRQYRRASGDARASVLPLTAARFVGECTQYQEASLALKSFCKREEMAVVDGTHYANESHAAAGTVDRRLRID